MNFGYRRLVDNIKVMIKMAPHEHSKLKTAHFFVERKTQHKKKKKEDDNGT